MTAISFQIRAVKVRDSSTLMVRSKISMQGINNEYGDRIYRKEVCVNCDIIHALDSMQ